MMVYRGKDSFITTWTEMSKPMVTQVTTRYQMKARGIIFPLIPLTGESILFERYKTVPEKRLVLRVGFDPSGSRW